MTYSIKSEMFLRKMLLIVCGMAVLLLISWGIVQVVTRDHAISVDDLWQMRYDGQEIDDKTFVIKGHAVFDLHSDFYPNGLYLVDAQTPNDRREPAYGYWFGIAIADLTCNASDKAMICQPFDPSRATAFELRGTVHSVQVGKRRVMWLSDIDFEKSRQLVDGKWQPIPFGQFELPIEVKQ